jgi:molybdenum cofactor cytidylyltransferase
VKISGVVLAAGTSSRLGEPKQLLELAGHPLLQHVVDAASAAGLDELVVVVGHHADEVREAIALPESARFVVNPDYATGQASSLRSGLEAAAESGADAALILLGDQPSIPAAAIRAVAEAGANGAGPVVQASYRGRPGHPTLFARSLWPELLAVEGDKGARDLIQAHPEWVRRIEVDGDPPPDLDTYEDYERLRARYLSSERPG